MPILLQLDQRGAGHDDANDAWGHPADRAHGRARASRFDTGGGATGDPAECRPARGWRRFRLRQQAEEDACPPLPAGAPRLCLAVFDEGGEARYLTLEGGALRPQGERIVLLPGKVELDAEAAATDGRFYYVAGSHSAKRSDCKTNPDASGSTPTPGAPNSTAPAGQRTPPTRTPCGA